MFAIQLNIRLNSGQNDYVPMELNSTGKIKDLREEVSKVSKLPADEILLIYCCGLLKDVDTVEDTGMTAGDVVLCLRVQAPRIDEAASLTTIESYEVHRDLARLMRNKNRHPFFQHMQSGPFSSSALTRVAGAWQDPGALQLLQDTTMLYNYAKETPDNLGLLFSNRPVLGRLMQHILEVYKKEGPWGVPSPLSPSTSAFSLDALYEQDEDDHYASRSRSSNSSSNAGPAGAGAFPSLPAITPAQLAAALANATGGGGSGGPPNLPVLQPPQRGGQPSVPGTPSNTPASHTSNTPSSAATSASASASHTPASASASTPQQQSSLPHITSEMLNSALQSVMGAATGGSVSGASPIASSPQPAPPIAPSPQTPNLEESVKLMAEMGIPDEALSRQALVMTNGDVQAAVELVFAQLNMFD